jgi:hypothetical protein
MSDSWVWSGAGWDRVDLPGPGPRAAALQACYDSVRAELVLYAGERVPGVCPARETWALRTGGGPLVAGQPLDAIGCAGAALRMSVSAPGAALFRWQVEDDSLPHGWTELFDGPNIIADRLIVCAGVDTAELSIAMPGLGGTATVRCVVANTCAAPFTEPARATFCAADFDCNGVTGSADFFAFLGAFFGALPGADINADGSTDAGDLFSFLGVFFSPCGV